MLRMWWHRVSGRGAAGPGRTQDISAAMQEMFWEGPNKASVDSRSSLPESRKAVPCAPASIASMSRLEREHLIKRGSFERDQPHNN
jgi:hypothetical protein